ncbi:hypothetical protein [Saccharothrix sp. ST-888]|uniref:hypothetical protein n=1 Tax=Saccharothrix sp. ST-888 TaxID=1427391 RepID=UPI0012DFF95E|nr:hypothetical protein [Saccharothrix sp. ST-888]
MPTAAAAAVPGAAVRFAAHFDLSRGQTPENVTQEPDGDLDVTFSVSRQVARVGADGATRILATMPLPADGGVNTPVLHFAATMGIVRGQDGTLYCLYAAGSADLTGVWRIRPHGNPERIAALPANGLPNGMALDPRSSVLYVADSVLGTIWTVPTTGGAAAARTHPDGRPAQTASAPPARGECGAAERDRCADDLLGQARAGLRPLARRPGAPVPGGLHG